MRQWLRSSFILLSCLILFACGVGNKLTTTDGDDSEGTEAVLMLTLSLIDDSGNSVTNVDGADIVNANVLVTSDGEVSPNS
ncbi:MAG: hypothetical protein HRU25_15170, partial [Psychrobium sp.]|nr:hypothetical protein [Psychrobium sp.]